MPDKKPTHEERVAGLREELRTALADATCLIETAPDTSPDAWFEFSERLGDACWKLAAATNRPSAQPEPDSLCVKPPPGRHYRRRQRCFHRRGRR